MSLITARKSRNKKGETMNKLISVGLDAGMGAIKLWSRGGGLDVLSQVAINGSGHLEGQIGLKTEKRPLAVTTSDGEFYVGAKAHSYGRPIENLDFGRLFGSPEMRALVYGSWTRYMQEYGAFDAPLSVMVGLPLQTMGDDMKDARRNLRKWLAGPHQWMADGVEYSLNVERVRWTSQPVGALFDFVLDNGLEIPQGRGSALTDEVGVVSVGFNTVELMVIENQVATEKFTRGEKYGVRRLLELLYPSGQYSLGELDVKLRAGNLKYRDKLPIWAREVNGVIEAHWGEALDRFAAVLVVGGGAVLLGDHLNLRGKKVELENPVFAISHGLEKLDRKKG
jgi:hypothetical protein